MDNPRNEQQTTEHKITTSDRIRFAEACMSTGLLEVAAYHIRRIDPKDFWLPTVQAIRLELEKLQNE